MSKKCKKRNWKYVEVSERDIKLFKIILEQKFLRRSEVITHIFEGKKDYAETRLQKLKKFDYLRTMQLLVKEPESYLVGLAGIKALREAGYSFCRQTPGGNGRLPDPQDDIELASYRHDVKVTLLRFLFEGLRFCTDWKSEKVLKLGTQGERKVPDGFFTRNKKGIAIEVELKPKKPETYRKIFRIYNQDSKIDYVFYLCGDVALMRKIMRLTDEACVGSSYCFVLFDELMHFKREAIFRTADGKGKFKLKEVLS
jgi:hypothetical protein